MRATLCHVATTLLLLFSALQARAQLKSTPRVVDYPSAGVQLGNGWDSTVSLKTSSACIRFDKAEDKAEQKTAYIHSISDKSSLMNELQISAEVQVKAAFVSASAKTDFVHNTEVKDEYQNFVARAVVRNGAVYTAPSVANHNIDLLPRFRSMVSSNPAEFFRQCGDSFVSAQFGGAELDAVLTFRTHSVDDRQNLKVSVEGSGWGVEAKGSVASALKSYTEKNELTIVYHQLGGSGDPIPTDQAGLDAAIRALPTAAVAAPYFYEIEITRYDSLPSWPAAVAGWKNTAFGRIASRYGQLASLHDQLVAILNQPGDFILGRGVTVASLNALEGKLLTHVRSLSGTAKTCIQSGGQDCAINPADDIQDYAYRVLLPVPQQSFPEDVAIRNAEEDLQSKQAALAKKRADFANFNLKATITNFRFSPERIAAETAPDVDAVKQAEDYLKKLKSQYPDALRAAVVKYWIQGAVDDRCRFDINDPDCISRQEVEALKVKVPAN